MAQNERDSLVARAWQLHREGRQNDAISQFEAVLKTAPDDLDAHYGLALAQRSAGMTEAALENLKQAATAVSRAIETDPSIDRYQMLQRMVQQRISEMQLRASHASQ